MTQPMPAPCKACEQHRANAWSGAYFMRCVQCCARLVISARPNRLAQEAMLLCITRRQGNPSKADIINTIKTRESA